MVQKLSLQGRQVWLKQYDRDPWFRPAITAGWNLLARRLHAVPLRSPPRRDGDGAKQVERRRLEELAAGGVRVPTILGEGPRSLILSDVGRTLGHHLKRADNQAQIDTMVGQVAGAIGRAHRQGAYLGQAFARNITLDAQQRVGFIDFEEDPLEVMPLAEAQARDWMMFGAGVAAYYPGHAQVLAGLLREPANQVSAEVGEQVRQVTARLGFLERRGWCLAKGTRSLSTAVRSLRKGFAAAALAIALAADYLSDGDLDAWRALSGGLQQLAASLS